MAESSSVWSHIKKKKNPKTIKYKASTGRECCAFLKKKVDLDVSTQKLLSKNKKQAVALVIDVKNYIVAFFKMRKQSCVSYMFHFLRRRKEKRDSVVTAAPDWPQLGPGPSIIISINPSQEVLGQGEGTTHFLCT
jgi:hypothetical protein